MATTLPPRPDVEEELRELRERFGVTGTAQIVAQRGFTGADAALVVATYVLPRIADALLKGAGSELWAAIKRICRKLRGHGSGARRAATIEVVVAPSPGQRGATFTCHLDAADGDDGVEAFVAGAIARIAELQRAPGPGAPDPARATYEHASGSWTTT